MKMTDILSREKFDLSNPKVVKVTIPCELNRFIDVELQKALFIEKN